MLALSSVEAASPACACARGVVVSTRKATKPPFERGVTKYCAERAFSLSEHVVAARKTTSLSTRSLERADANFPLHKRESAAIRSDTIPRPERSGRGKNTLT